MANSIRTPSVGKSSASRAVAAAVDDEDWQKFRVTLKGTSTEYKLRMLREYLEDENLNMGDDTAVVELRVDNYLKALARGGQIAPINRTRYLQHLQNDTLIVRK